MVSRNKFCPAHAHGERDREREREILFDMGIHTSNPSTWETEPRRMEVQDKPALHKALKATL